MGVVEAMFGSLLVSGVVMLCIASVILVAARREVRLRPDAWWTSNDAVAIGIAPVSTVTLALGIGQFFAGLNAWYAQPVSPQGWAISVAAVIVAGLSLYLLSRETNEDARGTHTAMASN